MDADRIATAETCLKAAHDGSLGFPQIIDKLVDAGFEGYAIDYRRSTQTFYLPDGDNAQLDMPRSAGSVAETFSRDEVQSLVRWAQADGPDYSYPAFCARVKAAGCAGYIVSFTGRRVVYYGRSAETHVELFPQ